MKAIRVYFALIAVLALFLPNPAQTEDRLNDLHIGAVLPLTGEVAWFGTAARDGMELAVAELGQDSPKLTIEDDRSVNKTATVTAVHKLISVGDVDAIFLSAVSNASAVDTIVNAASIPSFILFDSSVSVLSMGQYVYGFGHSNEAVGELAADYVNRLYPYSESLLG